MQVAGISAIFRAKQFLHVSCGSIWSIGISGCVLVLVFALILPDVDDDNDLFKSHFSAISLSQKCCAKGIPLP